MLLNKFKLLKQKNRKQMKNLKYIIAPAIAIAMFASCNSEVAAPSQAELDTQVEAKVKAATDQLKAECDSRIMSAAQMSKDSILVALGNKKPAAAAPAPKPASAPIKAAPVKQEPVKAEPVKPKGGLKGLSDQAKQEAGNPAGKGLKGLSDQAKEKAKEEAPKKGGLKGLSDQSK
jgi:hypothetical protein